MFPQALVFLLTLVRPASGADLDPWDLVRVDQPDHPDALLSSSRGSVLATAPADMAWRVEEIPWPDLLLAEELGLPSTVEAPSGEGGTAWEALDAMSIRPWHEAGVDGGRGGDPVRVAIFDTQWGGLTLAGTEGPLAGNPLISSHDCHTHRSCEPAIDDLRPFFSWESGGHGLACAEVILAVSPGVRLYLVRVSTQTALENAVDWASREGIEVVSMSMSFFNGSFYDGTGPIAEIMDRLHAGGALMVTSAGNYSTQHWSGAFRDLDRDGTHEFSDERRTLPVYLGAGTYRFMLSWDDFDRCGRTDLDAYVYADDGRVIGRSERLQQEGEDCEPVERVRVNAEVEGWTYLEVRRASGADDVRLDVLARGGQVWEGRPGGSVTDPGTHPAVLTVGAVRADGYLSNDAESFSSQGPTLGGLDKPDLAGPDGLSTSVYGPTGFYGTSASTPAVVGAIALLMDQDPGIDAFEAARRLRSHTLSDDQAVWAAADPALGSGKVRLASPEGGSRCAGGLFFAPGLLLLAGLRSGQRHRQAGKILLARTRPSRWDAQPRKPRP